MANHKKRLANSMPMLDENWWASVLAEESRHSGPSPAKLPANRREGIIENKTPTSERKVISDWKQIKDLYLRDQIIELQVTGYNRGGLLVEGDGVFGFVPMSHLVDIAVGSTNLQREQDLTAYVGRTLKLKVIECIPEDGRIVFSERAAQSGPGKRAELFHTLRPGQMIQGTVTNITDFGVFVDLGGVEGLIHISEVSWGRVSHPGRYVRIGEVIQVQVLELSQERCRVALSLKRLQPNPWTNADAEFPVGQILPATITSLLSFGAFARLDAGVEGLIHASEIPAAEGKHVKEILSEGQRVQVRVLHVDSAHQRMGLSMRLN
ncbi:MAG: S1 RNA-binding domain-containing protein [Chloroflexi bacterium]|nr:S1 RNA-binding domain-containing protein [Chloroflexota bacterium]